MKTQYKLLWIIPQLFCMSLFADLIYMVGRDEPIVPTYWTFSPPALPNAEYQLNIGANTSGYIVGVAFSPTQTVYMTGAVRLGPTQTAVYWTVSPSGTASSLVNLATSTVAAANDVAFSPSGIGYIVGIDDSENAAYWTISTSGIVSSSHPLMGGGSANAVAFSSLGNGYIAGKDSSSQAVYWPISSSGIVGAPVSLPMGGVDSNVADVAVSSTGIPYIAGSSENILACYWTDVSSGAPNPAIHLLDGVGALSSARGVAFLSSGEGMIVGSTSPDDAVYWPISIDGSIGSIQPLPNGGASTITAIRIAFSSDQTAYIVGAKNSIDPIYWTVPIGGSPSEPNLLPTNHSGAALNIAIFSPPQLNPPTNLTARLITNDFGLLYEYCAVLNWTPSISNGVIAYDIYQNGLKIGSVNSSSHEYQNHDQNKSQPTVYAVKAIDASGNESVAATITLN